MTDATGNLVAQRYRLTRVIGAGGMGRVWLGQDELIGREVAIKELLLPAGLDAEQRAMLCHRAMREAQLAGRLNHPGIVTVHDVVEYNGTPMIVMEFVRGGSLGDVIKAQGALPVEEVARIGTAVLSALRVAHEAGIVHRDLKPANVLLAGDRVVITDFGIARLTGDVQLTSSGTIIGTPAYMAPEQGAGAPITPATDLWSLGATLYAAVEGRPPFEGPDFVSTLTALLTTDPRPPVRAGRLIGVLSALLRKNPAERATADQVAYLLAGTGAPPAPVPARTGVPRRTLLLAGGGALAAIGAASAWWLVAKDSDDLAGPSSNEKPNNNVPAKGGAAEQNETSTPAEPGKPVEITEHFQLTGHTDQVTSVAFSPDGTMVASGDGDLSRVGPTVHLWDAATGKLITKLVGPPGTGGASACAVAFSPDGKLLAAGGNYLGDSTRLWNVADRKVAVTLDESRSIMKSLAFSPDGKTVAGVTHTGGTKLWDAATGKVRIGLPDGDGGRNVTFSADGKLLAYGGTGKGSEVKVCDPATGKTVQSINDATGSDVSFSPDGKTLAVADADGKHSLRLWDVASGQSKAVFDRTEEITVTSVLYSPDGKTLAVWGLGNTIQLWDVASAKIRAVVIGSAGKVQSVVFDAKGTRIAAGGDDKVVRIWKLS